MHIIHDRFNKANKEGREDFHCVTALFYLLGIDQEEQPHDVEDAKQLNTEKVSRKEADFICVENPLHYMVIDPEDRDHIIHRNGGGAPMVRQQSHHVFGPNFFTGVGYLDLDEIITYHLLIR